MIEVRLADLADVAADAMIRPVSTDFTAVTPAMRRFELAAGEAVAEQCRMVGELPLGAAIITQAGDLDADLVVHVAVRSATDNPSRPVVRQGFLNALRRVSEWGASVMAVAPLGTGAGNLDAETAANVMLEVLAEQWEALGGVERIILVAEDAYQETAFNGAVARHLGDGSAPAPVARNGSSERVGTRT